MNLTESQMLYIVIASEHNKKIINKALDTLKQFTEDGTLWLYDKNGNSFKLTPDTEWITLNEIK